MLVAHSPDVVSCPEMWGVKINVLSPQWSVIINDGKGTAVMTSLIAPQETLQSYCHKRRQAKSIPAKKNVEEVLEHQDSEFSTCAICGLASFLVCHFF